MQIYGGKDVSGCLEKNKYTCVKSQPLFVKHQFYPTVDAVFIHISTICQNNCIKMTSIKTAFY